MPILFQNALVGHVVLGLFGILFSAILLILLLKKDFNIKVLRLSSFVAFLSFLGSWITGGSYYVNYYGSNVKPGIKAGDYRWAHSVVMETKEHVFLFLPILSAFIFLALLLLGKKLKKDRSLKNALTFLVLLVVLIGLFISFMGLLISSAADAF